MTETNQETLLNRNFRQHLRGLPEYKLGLPRKCRGICTLCFSVPDFLLYEIRIPRKHVEGITDSFACLVFYISCINYEWPHNSNG